MLYCITGLFISQAYDTQINCFMDNRDFVDLLSVEQAALLWTITWNILLKLVLTKLYSNIDFNKVIVNFGIYYMQFQLIYSIYCIW